MKDRFQELHTEIEWLFERLSKYQQEARSDLVKWVGELEELTAEKLEQAAADLARERQRTAALEQDAEELERRVEVEQARARALTEAHGRSADNEDALEAAKKRIGELEAELFVERVSAEGWRKRCRVLEAEVPRTVEAAAGEGPLFDRRRAPTGPPKVDPEAEVEEPDELEPVATADTEPPPTRARRARWQDAYTPGQVVLVLAGTEGHPDYVAWREATVKGEGERGRYQRGGPLLVELVTGEVVQVSKPREVKALRRATMESSSGDGCHEHGHIRALGRAGH